MRLETELIFNVRTEHLLMLEMYKRQSLKGRDLADTFHFLFRKGRILILRFFLFVRFRISRSCKWGTMHIGAEGWLQTEALEIFLTIQIERRACFLWILKSKSQSTIKSITRINFVLNPIFIIQKQYFKLKIWDVNTVMEAFQINRSKKKTIEI